MTRHLLVIYALALSSVTRVAYAQQPSTVDSPRAVTLSYAQFGANCPAMAVTKWILATYGVNSKGVFSSQTDTKTGITTVSLPSNKFVTVTSAELAIATRHSDFNPQDLDDVSNPPDAHTRKTMLDKANLLYAVLGIRKAGAYDGTTLQNAPFEHAIKKSLDGGGEVDTLFELLGYTWDDTENFPANNSVSVFGNVSDDGSTAHVVFGFVEDGQDRYDEHGSDVRLMVQDFAHQYGGGKVWRYRLETTGPGVPDASNLKVARQCMANPSGGQWHACA